MALDPASLLRRLEPAVRPRTAPAALRTAPHHGAPFDHALDLVSGRGPSARPSLTVAADAALGEPIDDEQLARLATAADEAEAAGAERAVMLIDGRAMIVEVGPRTLAAELTGESEQTRFEVDAALFVPDANDSRAPRVLGTPAAGVIPHAVVRQLLAAADHV